MIMKNILVLTDFSIKAACAAEFAMHLAIKTRTNLLLCHAVEHALPITQEIEFSWLPINNEWENDCLAELKVVKRNLEEVVVQYNSDCFKPNITYTCATGTITSVTSRILKKNTVGLIVCGSHKANNLFRFFSESHSHAIMDNINCPVLFIPEGLKFKGVENITYATDLSFNNSKVIPYLAKLAVPLNAGLAVNHISVGEFSSIVPDRSITYALRKLLVDDLPALSYHCIQHVDVRAALLEMTSSGTTGILVLVHKKYDFMERLLNYSMSKHLSGRAQIPLLILPFDFSQDTADITEEELEHYCYDAADLR
ncbi:MAG: universal stress protein [Pedobacter sp.]|nr:MAG: universal stress protein [Pedobacter sp.]